MYRQVRRRITREWDKLKCFTICTGKVTLDEIPYTAVDCAVKISDDTLFWFNLSMFKRWRLFPCVVVDGFIFRGLWYELGVASDEWLDEHFGESDEDFEL